MPAIHGKSHQVIKHFRKKPAALAVYWIYVSRANYENVSFPSVSGLGRDTGWNRDTCAAARKWLVEHGALELVKDYVRPKWRDLPKKELQIKKHLDRSEYYRPTGKLIIDGVVHNLLYFGGEESSNIEEELTPEPNTPPDVPPRRLSNASTDDDTDGRQNGTELDSISELDSKELNVVPLEEKSTPSGVDANGSKSRKKDELYDLIAETWNTQASGWIVTLKAMLSGTAKRGAWKTCNFDTPATADELQAFRDWNSTRGWHIPQTPEEIQRRFYDFRRTAAAPMSENDDTPAPVDNPARPDYPASNLSAEQHAQWDAMMQEAMKNL
jgi:hypothetical protein